MGAFKKEKYKGDQECFEKEKIVKPYVICLWSFLVSMAGGLLLLWWDYEYHPTNSQLWMVPFGLILFVTPVIAWFAVVVSESCNYKVDDTYTNNNNNNDSKTIELVV